MRSSTVHQLSGLARFVLAAALIASCAGDAPPPAPRPWTGFFHPPPKPGSSITSSKQCECRACDPANCCSSEHLESSAAAAPECSNSYEFSEKCGLTVQTCTPRCYTHVWRVAKQDSCTAELPLVCCDR